MTDQPIKLTDEVLERVEEVLDAFEDIEFAEPAIAAIRALRDRARAVVDDADAKHWIITGSDDDCVVGWDKVRALREVLP